MYPVPAAGAASRGNSQNRNFVHLSMFMKTDDPAPHPDLDAPVSGKVALLLTLLSVEKPGFLSLNF